MGGEPAATITVVDAFVVNIGIAIRDDCAVRFVVGFRQWPNQFFWFGPFAPIGK